MRELRLSSYERPHNSHRTKILSLGIFLFVVVYGAMGFFVPDIPYKDNRQIIYPLLVLYKEPPYALLLHFSLIALVVLVGFIFGVRVIGDAPTRSSTVGLLLLSCGLMTWIDTRSILDYHDYQHHDSVHLDEHLYQLGSSLGPDPLELQYLVYRCDQFGIICELISVPYSGIDRSQMPDSTPQARSATFADSDDGTLSISVTGQNYPVQLDGAQ